MPVPEGPFGAQRTVLLVEDEDQVRRVAKRLLESLGFVVLDTSNGVDAIKLGEQHKDSIALLLTDVIMPLMSGPELAQQLVQRISGLPVVYMSGYTDDAISRHGINEADCLLLQKPFSARGLREILAPLFVPEVLSS
jgi:CheY-like chemotaxis protein